MARILTENLERYFETSIIISFMLGILHGIFFPWDGVFEKLTEMFINFFVIFAPIIIFILIFLASSRIALRMGFTPSTGGKILLYTLLFSYLAVSISAIYAAPYSHITGGDMLNLFLVEMLHITPKILTSPLTLSIAAALGLPLILNRYILKWGELIDRSYRAVITGFKSILYIMPIISFGFGHHLYIVTRRIFVEYLVTSLGLEIIYGFTYLIAASFIASILTEVNIWRMLNYSLKTFILCIPAGGSYMALPINLKVYSDMFGDDQYGVLAISVGASINRAASSGGAVLIIALTSMFTGYDIGLGRLIILGALIPFIALGAPGIFGGTLIVGISLISDILGISSTDPLATLSLAMFVSVLTYILAPLNTLTNGLIGVIVSHRR